jgi:DNA polymerase III alpha subunit
MPDYVELHCHSNYSLLDGASHPETLLDRAQELGMDSLAVTDHDGLYASGTPLRSEESSPSSGLN